MKIVLTEITDKIEKHVWFLVTFFPQNCALYGILWKNTVESDRPLMTTCITDTAHALCMLG